MTKHWKAPLIEADPEEKPEKSYGDHAPGELDKNWNCLDCGRPGSMWNGRCAWCADWHLP